MCSIPVVDTFVKPLPCLILCVMQCSLLLVFLVTVAGFSAALRIQQEDQLEKCPTETRESGSCATWSQYLKKGAFNRSNVELRFAEGTHNINGGPFLFQNVSNISFTCASGVCQISCATQGNCVFYFSRVTNVTITSLTFDFSTASFKPLSSTPSQKCFQQESSILNISAGIFRYSSECLTNRSWIFIDSTNIDISGVHFIGPQNSWAVVRPRGRFTVDNCSFTELSSGLWEYDHLHTSTHQYHIVVIVEPPASHNATSQTSGDPTTNELATSNERLLFNVENTNFSGYYLPSNSSNYGNYPVILLVSAMQLDGWSVDFTIRNSTFIQCPVLQVFAVEDPGLYINLEHSYIDGRVDNKTAFKWLRQYNASFTGTAVRIHLFHSNETCDTYAANSQEAHPLGLVRIASNIFTRLGSDTASAIFVNFTIMDGQQHAMSVLLYDNTFVDNHGFQHRNLIHARHNTQNYSNSTACGDLPVGVPSFSYPLQVQMNRFEYNFEESKIDYHCAILTRWDERFIIVHADTKDHNSQYKVRFACYRLGAVYLSGLKNLYRVQLVDNSFVGNKVAGMTLYDSHIEMHGTNLFQGNLGYYGAGIRMIMDSLILFRDDTKIELVENQAYFSGGGIYILDQCTFNITINSCPCFFQFIHDNGSYVERRSFKDLRENVNLIDNRAFNKGKGTASMIFNSNIDQCDMKTDVRTDEANNSRIFMKVFNITKPVDHFQISSIPRRIYISCPYNQESNTYTNSTLKYYHGQQLRICISLLGDMDIPLSGVLYVDLVHEKYRNKTVEFFLPELHSTHVLKGEKNIVDIPALPKIPRHFQNSEFALQLRVPLFSGTIVIGEGRYLYTSIKTKLLEGCPNGFHKNELNSHYPICQCDRSLEDAGLVCSLDTLTIETPTKKSCWIGVENGHLLWSFHCPRIHCNATVHNIPINNTDVQCRYGRTGFLCGRCPDKLSVIFGSSECRECTNWYLLLLLVVLIMGPLAIIIIGAINLTITVGAINGFMFYSIIVFVMFETLSSGEGSVLRSVFAIFTFSSLFPTCLYDGMDEFAKTLFAYFLPLYLLLLVGIACCLPKCRCVNMHKINRKIGPRITPVLATVITIAYLLISANVIKSLSYATVNSTDGSTTVVWLFDGSLTYFQSPQHIILGCIAIVMFLLFILPAALTATFGDLLRRFIKGPWYLNFLDTFHGAFRFGFGFWFGVRLLILTAIIIFKFTLKVDSTNVAILYLAIFILTFQMIAKPYRGMRIKECVTETLKEKYFSNKTQRNIVNLLDNTFQINLIGLFAYGVSVHQKKGIEHVLHLSVTIALIQFVFILLYHLLEYTPLGQHLIELQRRARRKYNKWKEERMLRAIEERNRLQEVPVQKVEMELFLDDCFKSDNEEEDTSDSEGDTGDHSDGDDDDMSHSDRKSAVGGGKVDDQDLPDRKGLPQKYYLGDVGQDLSTPLLMEALL